jgi:hypothetical protein
MSNKVRVRFCPSPTGDPHVGMVRTDFLTGHLQNITKEHLFLELKTQMQQADARHQSQDQEIRDFERDLQSLRDQSKRVE